MIDRGSFTLPDVFEISREEIFSINLLAPLALCNGYYTAQV